MKQIILLSLLFLFSCENELDLKNDKFDVTIKPISESSVYLEFNVTKGLFTVNQSKKCDRNNWNPITNYEYIVDPNGLKFLSFLYESPNGTLSRCITKRFSLLKKNQPKSFDWLNLNNWNFIDKDNWDADSDGNKQNDINFSVINNTLQIKSRGSDLWNNTHQFVAMYLDLNQDFDFAIKINTMSDNTNKWAKLGLIIANDLNDLSDGSIVSCMQTTNEKMSLQYSNTNNGSVNQNKQSGNSNKPKYLRMIKDGNSVSCYYKENMEDLWIEFNGSPISRNFNSNFQFGIWQTSHNNSKTLESEITEFYDILNILN